MSLTNVPQGSEVRQTGLRLPVDLLTKLKIEALETGETASQLATEAIRQYLCRRERKQTKQKGGEQAA